MPAGLDAMLAVWLPMPWKLTARVSGMALNWALTVVAAERLTEQGPVPVQPPPVQPVKVDVELGVAVSATTGLFAVRRNGGGAGQRRSRWRRWSR